MHHTPGAGHAAVQLPTTTQGLPAACPPADIDLTDGAVLDLVVAPVAKRLADTTVRMLAYNGSIPGPTVRAQQGSEIVVNVTNHADMETTVHWHGLRLENRFDGVPHETQSAVPVGGRFSYRVQLPDPGLYWYHPHVREDYAQELGLYGNILVLPDDPGYWPAADRDLVLTLDDILLDAGKVAPFSAIETTHAAMGRFGNLMLTRGEPQPRLTVATGEVVRLWLTNTANARVFAVRLPGARMKLVGGDSGRVEHEELVSDVLLAPSERAVVDVLFDHPGTFELEHAARGRSRLLATFDVRQGPRTPAAEAFTRLRHAPELRAERDELDRWLTTPPDKVLALVARMDHAADSPAHEHGTASGHHAGSRPASADGPHEGGGSDGIEWEDDMPEANRQTTSASTHWRLVDRTTGADADRIDWHFTVGDRVKIRLVNEMESDHPMHHPFHVHGAGRFLVLARGGRTEPNLVWKDTVLVRTGQTVDILLDVTNPGVWMAHCHIPEHMHSGMMFSFSVGRATGSGRSQGLRA